MDVDSVDVFEFRRESSAFVWKIALKINMVNYEHHFSAI